jgi:SAM-dependent methyltransferase
MLPEGARVLDLGAKDGRGKRAAAGRKIRYIAADLCGSPGIDLLADAHALPLRTCSVDAVFCVSVLMYCRNPFRVISEIFRVLKPGGLVYLSTAFVYRVAPDPDDYCRFSASGLAQLCEEFQPIQTGFNRGPASTMADLLPHFFALLFSFNSNALRSVLLDVFQWAFFWIKYFDLVLNRYAAASVIHSGAFFFGRKPAPRPESNPVAHAGILASAR